jgi:hypothetical protein
MIGLQGSAYLVSGFLGEVSHGRYICAPSRAMPKRPLSAVEKQGDTPVVICFFHTSPFKLARNPDLLCIAVHGSLPLLLSDNTGTCPDWCFLQGIMFRSCKQLIEDVCCFEQGWFLYHAYLQLVVCLIIPLDHNIA